MKKILCLLAMVGAVQMFHAQESGKFRVGLDLGYAAPDGGGGVLIALEPKYNIADNMNVGLRIESAAMGKNVSNGALSQESNLAFSGLFVGTFDYYFSNGSTSFAPFVGVGMGYSSLANISFDAEGFEDDEADLDGKFGSLVRAGFELGKFRLAATYNMIGRSKVGDTKIKNSYFGISLGFYVGGGKWKR